MNCIIVGGGRFRGEVSTIIAFTSAALIFRGLSGFNREEEGRGEGWACTHINAVQAPRPQFDIHTGGEYFACSGTDSCVHVRREIRMRKQAKCILRWWGGMKAMLAESADKERRRVGKGCANFADSLNPIAAPRRSEIRPLHAAREFERYTTWPFEWGLDSEYLRYIHVESFSRVLQWVHVRYIGGHKVSCERALNKGGMPELWSEKIEYHGFSIN